MNPDLVNTDDGTRTARFSNNRSIHGAYATLFPGLERNPRDFIKYTRMSISTFEYILSKINSSLTKRWCNLHTQPILPEQRLVLTLRLLATGNTYTELAFTFRMAVIPPLL